MLIHSLVLVLLILYHYYYYLSLLGILIPCYSQTQFVSELDTLSTIQGADLW